MNDKQQMIKVDGEKIKEIRERQGLTQLYLATAVQVTTDTISRWENRRYPSIKRENGEKLAEALGVSLEDILLDDGETQLPTEDPPPSSSTTQKKNRNTLFLLCVVALLLAITAAVGLMHFNRAKPSITAVRLLPSATIPGSPFPVIIEVHNLNNDIVSLILKDILPPGCTVMASSPSEGSSFAVNEVKWIHKIEGSARFAYLVNLTGKPGDVISFSGNIAISTSNQNIDVQGHTHITLGDSHWADSDGDKRISDQEILAVFDRYSDLDDLPVDIDLIEKMWLGSSYAWDSSANRVSINP